MCDIEANRDQRLKRWYHRGWIGNVLILLMIPLLLTSNPNWWSYVLAVLAVLVLAQEAVAWWNDRSDQVDGHGGDDRDD